MPQRCVITIGNFDGVHRGHQAILARARAVADQAGLSVTAITFDPFPLHVLKPQAEPARLMNLTQRTRHLEQAGADRVAVVEPTPQFLAQTPAQFLEWLVAQYAPWAIVEGADFRFGKGRSGDMPFLARAAAAGAFQVLPVASVAVPLTDLSLVRISSSLIRWLLAQGRVQDAAVALGRWFTLDAPVVRGEERGRTIGIPTANLEAQVLAQGLVPCHGVYAGLAHLPSGATWPAAISVGVKPTFGSLHRVVEAHLLDFSGDLYGQRIVLAVARWLRDQQAFPGKATLVRQLQGDLAQVRELHRLGLLDDPIPTIHPQTRTAP